MPVGVGQKGHCGHKAFPATREGRDAWRDTADALYVAYLLLTKQLERIDGESARRAGIQVASKPRSSMVNTETTA